MPVKVYDGTNWVTVAGDGQQGPAATSSSIATWVKTASGGETSVSGTGDAGYGTLSYTVGQELVYLNGVLLDRGDDYTATNGTSITGLTALNANDVVTVWTVNSFSVANTYTVAQADSTFAPVNGVGLKLITSSPFTTVSSHSVNNCFTTTYQNYLLLITFTAASTDGPSFVMRMRASGADTSTSYQQTRLYALGSTVGADTAITDGFFLNGLDKDFPDEPLCVVTLANPQAANRTSFVNQAQNRGASVVNYWSLGGFQDSSTQFDGFTILTDSGTMSGRVRVYGYQNS